MKCKKFIDLFNTTYLGSTNIDYINKLYNDWKLNPNKLHKSWHIFFSQYDYKKNTSFEDYKNTFLEIKKILNMVNFFRSCGFLNANLDPLGLYNQQVIPFPLEKFGIFNNLKVNDISNLFTHNFSKLTFQNLPYLLKKTYCGSIGIEYMHLIKDEEKEWIQNKMESITGKFNFSDDEKKKILKELTAAESIEHYLGMKFPGTKRFSLEGGESLILIIKEIIRKSIISGIKEIIIGMAHRGRLNVLVNIFGKKTKYLFNEFSKEYHQSLFSGDVKYHQGYYTKIKNRDGEINLELAFNPSHLEIISPVVMGLTRASIDKNNKSLPIVIHGDVSISGQGVVQETFNMSKVKNYDVGGTIHIIVNNQIGFTTSNKEDIRSTKYCSDITKIIFSPIFHVNADDPEAVVSVSRIALDFKHQFNKDVIIDLVCYRRNGHNEADNPYVTQPLMYNKIKKHLTSRQIYADFLVKKGTISLEETTHIIEKYYQTFDIGDSVIKSSKAIPKDEVIKNFLKKKVINSLNIDYLKKLAYKISNLPINLSLHPLVKNIYNNRVLMAKGDLNFDWGGAENLAYATILDNGISIRLSGEDTTRGTFFHRHIILYDQINGYKYIPLSHIRNGQGNFNGFDSVLSEEAALAFEYGYSIKSPESLIIWEAQFGDFSNVAQIVIDQFISSSEKKWGKYCGIVMFLPHGYEGQGPEHSSARIERYLQLCAENNMHICIPSTPAQLYHLLRYQALIKPCRPLIIITPKSLLFNKKVVSSFNELTKNKFYPVIDDCYKLNNFSFKRVQRVIMCSGKVYYDLANEREKKQILNIAIIRIEQFYPFPEKTLRKILFPYFQVHVKDFIWCQEEPENQGAWRYIYKYIREIIPSFATLNYVGRDASASPAVGYFYIHNIQQKKLINKALNVNKD